MEIALIISNSILCVLNLAFVLPIYLGIFKKFKNKKKVGK